MPSKEAGHWGRKAEKRAAKKFGLRLIDAPFYDGAFRSNGSKVQIKACDTERDNPRFRFWRSDHKKLKGVQGSYILLTYSSDTGRYGKIWKVSTAKVERAATWSPANHKEKSGKQAKIHWRSLV